MDIEDIKRNTLTYRLKETPNNTFTVIKWFNAGIRWHCLKTTNTPTGIIYTVVFSTLEQKILAKILAEGSMTFFEDNDVNTDI